MSLNMLISLTAVFLLSYYQSSIVQMDPVLEHNPVFIFFIQTITYLINFVTLLGLLYLFYY